MLIPEHPAAWPTRPAETLCKSILMRAAREKGSLACSWQSGTMDFAAVRTAEEELLTSAARHNQSRLRELLHPDFVEIGRSGRRWTRDEIVAALADEDDRPTTHTDEWEFVGLGPDLTLATYIVRNADGDSRHSSIWAREEGRLQMRFHQGTQIARQ